MRRTPLAGLVCALALLVSGCVGEGGDVADPGLPAPADEADAAAQRFPDVLDAVLTEGDDGTFTVAVTLSSPYDTPERYADAWRVLSPDRTELGVRVLAHDHADEQPFTRQQTAITIPPGIGEVVIQGRDLANGWGGTELTVAVPGR